MLRTAFDGDSGTRTRTSGATSEAAFTTISPAGRRVHPPFGIGSGDLFASRAVVTPLTQEDW